MSAIPKATSGAIRWGVAPREGNGNGDPHPERGEPKGELATETRPEPRSTGWFHRATGEASHPQTSRRGNPPGHPLNAAETLRATETERNAPPTDFGPCGTKPRPRARAHGGSEERQEGSSPQRCGTAADEEETFAGQGALGIPRTVRGGTEVERPPEHQRTPRDQQGEPHIWCQLNEAGGRERSKPSRWQKPRGRNTSEDGIFRPKRSERPSRGNAERNRRRAGEDVPGETRKRGCEQDEKFQERKDRSREIGESRADPARTPETTQRVRR